MYKGVNLGGWLVLERWITPSLFSGTDAADETAFMHIPDAREKLQRHRDLYIQRSDFEWIADRGLNALRIPIGHWIFGDCEPYIRAIDYLDWAMDLAAKYKLSVIIDLHAAPGSQNGWDHSGLSGKIQWHHDIHQNRSLTIVERLAKRYAHHPSLAGIELLNEPHWNLSHGLLAKYYQQGYEAVRRYGGDVAVIFHDAFRPFDWATSFPPEKYPSMVQDTHLYQCFDMADKRLSPAGHLDKTQRVWSKDLARISRNHQVIVGEWSLALDPLSLRGVKTSEYDEVFRSYGAAQLEAFADCAGWFFWTYKTEDMPHWSLREAVEKGWLPSQF